MSARRYRASAAGRIYPRTDQRCEEREAMFHHDDHIRLAFGAPRRPELSGARARQRNTDVNGVLDRLGLSGKARKL